MDRDYNIWLDEITDECGGDRDSIIDDIIMTHDLEDTGERDLNRLMEQVGESFETSDDFYDWLIEYGHI